MDYNCLVSTSYGPGTIPQDHFNYFLPPIFVCVSQVIPPFISICICFFYLRLLRFLLKTTCFLLRVLKLFALMLIFKCCHHYHHYLPQNCYFLFSFEAKKKVLKSPYPKNQNTGSIPPL